MNPFQQKPGGPIRIIRICEVGRVGRIVSGDSILFVILEGHYNGHVFFQKTMLPLVLNPLKWGLNEKSQVGRKLPKGLANEVISILLSSDDENSAKVTLKGGAAFQEDVEVMVLVDERFQKCIIPMGAEVKFEITITDVKDIRFPNGFAPRWYETRCILLFLGARRLMNQKYYEAAATKFDIILRYAKGQRILSQKLRHLSIMVFLMYGKLFGKLDEKLFSVKDTLKMWDEAFNLIENEENRLDIRYRLLGKIYFERGLLLWNLNQFQNALTAFKGSLNCMFKAQFMKEGEQVELMKFVFQCYKRDGPTLEKVSWMIDQTENKIRAEKERGIRS